MASAQEFLGNDEQKKDILAKFKANIIDCHDKLFDKRDEYLLKWLIARDFDLTQAEKMLRESLAWRQREGADDVVETWTPPEVINKYFSFGKLGYDKLGCPVYACAHGRMDLRGLLQSMTKKDYMKYQIWMTEKTNRELREESISTGKNPWCHITFIADMEELSIRQMAYKPAMDCGLEQTKIYEANYPENLRRIFVINAPKLFTVVFNWMKPFMHQATIEKIRIFGTDRQEWEKALLEEIDPDQLPQIYGGTMTDPDGNPKCPSKFNMGGEVPHSYYLSNSLPVAKDYMESMTIIAGAGGFKKLKFKVEEANSVLRWEFMSEGGDIGFRVYYKDPKEGDVDVIPMYRVESHLVMEDGEILCENPGKYVVQFDNTYSYVKTKKLRYCIVIDPPLTQQGPS